MWPEVGTSGLRRYAFDDSLHLSSRLNLIQSNGVIVMYRPVCP